MSASSSQLVRKRASRAIVLGGSLIGALIAGRANAEQAGSVCEAFPCAFRRQIVPRRTATRLLKATPSLHNVVVSEGYAVVETHSTKNVVWQAGVPLELMMERAGPAIGLPEALERGSGTGAGVVVGVIDTGIDANHVAFIAPDGTSRVAWWLDFLSPPLGLHADIEKQLGCRNEPGLYCAVLSGADIDAKRMSPEAFSYDLPEDVVGHGTHIASLAAGSPDVEGSRPAGVAPESQIIAVRAADPRIALVDANVLLAARFVFDRAAELGSPAVLNLSLGGEFGPHDGSSELASALAELVEAPGRAIVVAAGNGGDVFTSASDPQIVLGRHAEFDVSGSLELPVWVGAHALVESLSGGMLTWFNIYPANSVTVGLVGPAGIALPPSSQAVSTAGNEGLSVGVLQGTGLSPSAAALGEATSSEGEKAFSSAVGLVDGSWPADEEFRWQFEGTGHVDAWVQSIGALRSQTAGVGALLPNASPRQTVAIPAAHPALIAVGAVVNRLNWVDRQGDVQSVLELLPDVPLVGAPASFSAGGPNALGHIKPDLLAPGAFVAAALSAAADPRSSSWSGFSGQGICLPTDDCLVTREGLAVTQGTSMAAPLVSGAVALALGREPDLTQRQLLGAMRATTQEAAGGDSIRRGGGRLDLARRVTSTGEIARSRVSATTSRWVLARQPLLPDPARPVQLAVQLSAEDGELLDIAPERLRLAGEAVSIIEPLRRVGPAWFETWVAPRSTSPGGFRLTLFVDEQPTLEFTSSVGEPDAVFAEDSGCDCSLPQSRAMRRKPSGFLALALGFIWLLRRRVLHGVMFHLVKHR